MSEQLINHSPDLKRLRDEGYDISIVSSYLIIRDIPYVNAQRQVERGILISSLDLAGDLTTQPSDHTVMFSGDHPCDKNGMQLHQIHHQSAKSSISPEITSDHSFSCKPVVNGQKVARYENYYEKMITYIRVISNQALAIDENAKPETFNVISSDESDSPFQYHDSASSRANIIELSKKLEGYKIAIIGLGGTGSYLLDFVSKTPVSEIHIFDSDLYQQHNAFRSPGAAKKSDLQKKRSKVTYFAEKYSEMHTGVVEHECFVDECSIHILKDMDFVFICIDSSSAKRFIVRKLEEFDLPFIDVGLGLGIVNGALDGLITTTTSLPSKRTHFHKRVSLGDYDHDDNEYSTNIQIAELNALNATMAVIKWKKTLGFYADEIQELFSVYDVVGNKLISEEKESHEYNVAA